jgi:hypothetical protein
VGKPKKEICFTNPGAFGPVRIIEGERDNEVTTVCSCGARGVFPWYRWQGVTETINPWLLNE